jgi:hypothetical protein
MNRITTHLLRAAFVATAFAVLPATAATALTSAPPPSDSGTASTYNSPPPSGTYDPNTYNGGTANPGTSTSPSPSSEKPKAVHRTGSSYSDADCADTYKAYQEAANNYANAQSGSVQEEFWRDRMHSRWKEFDDNCRLAQ